MKIMLWFCFTILVVGCGNSDTAFSDRSEPGIAQNTPTVKPTPVDKIRTDAVLTFMAYSSVLREFVFNNRWEHKFGGKPLAVRKMSIAPQDIGRLPETFATPDIKQKVLEYSSGKVDIERDYDVYRDVIFIRGETLREVLATAQKRSQPLQMVAGLSEVFSNEDNSNALVYVEILSSNPKDSERAYCWIVYSDEGTKVSWFFLDE